MTDTKKNDLNTNQARAIPALLSHGTISAAAAALGLAEKTLYRYLEDPNFRHELNKAIRATTDAARSRLTSGQDEALETLEKIMTGDEANDTNKRLAAVAWLDFCLRYQAGDILERIEALEVAVYDDQKKN